MPYIQLYNFIPCSVAGIFYFNTDSYFTVCFLVHRN